MQPVFIESFVYSVCFVVHINGSTQNAINPEP
jgi:hypothetical protein